MSLLTSLILKIFLLSNLPAGYTYNNTNKKILISSKSVTPDVCYDRALFILQGGTKSRPLVLTTCVIEDHLTEYRIYSQENSDPVPIENIATSLANPFNMIQTDHSRLLIYNGTDKGVLYVFTLTKEYSTDSARIMTSAILFRLQSTWYFADLLSQPARLEILPGFGEASEELPFVRAEMLWQQLTEARFLPEMNLMLFKFQDADGNQYGLYDTQSRRWQLFPGTLLNDSLQKILSDRKSNVVMVFSPELAQGKVQRFYYTVQLDTGKQIQSSYVYSGQTAYLELPAEPGRHLMQITRFVSIDQDKYQRDRNLNQIDAFSFDVSTGNRYLIILHAQSANGKKPVIKTMITVPLRADND